MRRHYLIDSSALVPFIIPFKNISKEEAKTKLVIMKLLNLRVNQRVYLHVPNFCMAECSRVFVEIAFKAWKDISKAIDQYRKYVDALFDVVSKSRRGLIQSLNLKRKHLVNIEEIFQADHLLPNRGSEGFLSGLDGLIIAMAKDMVKSYGRNNVIIVTEDQKLARVCNESNARFPKAICLLKDFVPDS